MKKLSFKQAEKLHKELWGWLAENPDRTKCNWPEYDKISHFINECSACEFVFKGDLDEMCRSCRIQWPDKKDCYHDSSLFHKWEDAETPETRKKYAAIICDLPWVKQ
jgi:hypothetical protein